ncbi:MAG: 30S ribosomal protein S17 [bacterium]|nr:30S ribosomal protein S17 [bacterium]
MKRVLKGTVVSDKMDKTVVVKVDRVKTHPIYHKKYKASTKFMAHDESGVSKIGDEVEIAETRPMSKNKRWEVVEDKGSKK